MSGGSFNKANRPIAAGTYFNFDIVAPVVVEPSVGAIVALGITHDWGPFQVATPVVSIQDFMAKFGGSMDDPTPGLIAVYEAFKGENVPGFGGASEVIVYRMGASDAAKATHSFQNGTAAALKVSALYEGVRGNSISVTVQDHASDPTVKDEFVVLDTTGGASVVLERYVYPQADLAALANQINTSSRVISASVLLDGTKLAYVTGTALSAGADGGALVAQNYVDAMAALELVRFGVLAFEDLTDDAILTSLAAWTTAQNAGGRRFFLVVGGDIDDTITDAVTRSLELNDPDIINVGVGKVEDNDLLDAGGSPTVLSTAQLAPRIAGILAQRGSTMSLTFAKLAGLNLLEGATASDTVLAYDGGVLVLSRASDAQSTVRVEKGISTYTTTTDPTRPKSIYSVPRYVAVMHQLQTDLVAWADDTVIGQTTVDDETRGAVLGYVNTLLAGYQAVGSIQPGYTAEIDSDPPPSDSDEFIAIVIAASFGRSTEQVYFTAQLG